MDVQPGDKPTGFNQVFPAWTNTVARYSIPGALLLFGLAIVVLLAWQRSDFVTGVGVVQEQPVPFSHEHHVGGLGLDCRYCHTTVENGPSAGMPSTEICMTCHSQIWTNADVLEPVRQSYQTGIPIQWTRVYKLPDFVYFDHSIHVNKGVACESCHGRVDEMPLTRKNASLHMEWCLSCHRAPQNNLRPESAVFQMGWQGPRDQSETGQALMEKYHTPGVLLTNCWTCHR